MLSCLGNGVSHYFPGRSCWAVGLRDLLLPPWLQTQVPTPHIAVHLNAGDWWLARHVNLYLPGPHPFFSIPPRTSYLQLFLCFLPSCPHAIPLGRMILWQSLQSFCNPAPTHTSWESRFSTDTCCWKTPTPTPPLPSRVPLAEALGTQLP